MRVTFYDSETDNAPAPLELAWSELAAALSDSYAANCSPTDCTGRTCGHKRGAAWSPAHVEGTRSNANVVSVSALVLDLDHATALDLAALGVQLEGLAWVLHSTHSHTPDDPCYRLVLPFDRAALPHEYPRVRAAYVAALGLPADPSTKDLSRLYFLPTHRRGTVPVIVGADGAALSVDEALAEATPCEVRQIVAAPGVAGDAEARWAALSDDDRAWILAAARRRAAAHPPAIQGRATGSGVTFRLALELTRRLALPAEVALDVLRDHFNGRCLPPWTEAELRHKLEDAATSTTIPLGDPLENRRVVELFRARAARTAPSVPVERPTITVSPDEGAVIDEAITALARAPEIFARGSRLVEVITDDPTTRGLLRSGSIARIADLAESRLSELIAREALWLGSDGSGEGARQIHPPRWAVRGVMARGQWRGVRSIVGVATAPTMRPDGSLLTAPGYDPATDIFLAPSIEVDLPGAPTLDDARRAVATLGEVVADFPFATPAARSAWLAGVLSVAARPSIDGPCPLTLVDASVRGAGKSLLADVAAVIATGCKAARMIYSDDDAETRKLITAVALAGDPFVLLDNVNGQLGCAPLDAALTGTSWRDRILGASTMTAELPLRTTWWATANNATIGADLSRRSLLVRLEPGVEQPELRDGWRHPRLLEHVKAHRAELLGAALTIVRAYVVAGRPDMQLAPMGSYEAWSDLIRSALVWTGELDPCATISDLRAADNTLDALRAVVECWPAHDGEPITVRELLERAGVGGRGGLPPEHRAAWREALVEWCPPARGEALPDARAIGYGLRTIRRRVIGGRLLDRVAGHGRDGARWVRASS